MKRSRSKRAQAAARRRAKARRTEDMAELLYRAALVLFELVERREADLARRERAVRKRRKAASKLERAARKHVKSARRRERLGAKRERNAIKLERQAGRRDQAGDRDGRDAGKHAGDGRRAGRLIAWDDAPVDADGGVSTPSELERARLEALLQRAHLDPLTGAFRREAGRLALRNEIDRARRGDGRFVLAFVDVDGLKELNDHEGHGAGDHLLRTLVAIMRANLRSYDPIVRVGGDEFVCGIASIDEDEARHRLDVVDQSLRHATGTGITAGLATLTSNETLDELVARADSQLIEAKRERR